MADRPNRRTVSVFVTRSAEETEHFGRRLAASLPVPGVVLLRGPLGAGKTTLTRGIAAGLGVSDRSTVSSPSFTLVNIYEGRCPVYHVDLYRLEGERDIYSIGLEDFIGTRGVTIVEWSEKLKTLLPSATLIEIADRGDDTREILVQGRARPARQRRKSRAGSGHNRSRKR